MYSYNVGLHFPTNKCKHKTHTFDVIQKTKMICLSHISSFTIVQMNAWIWINLCKSYANLVIYGNFIVANGSLIYVVFTMASQVVDVLVVYD